MLSHLFWGKEAGSCGPEKGGGLGFCSAKRQITLSLGQLDKLPRALALTKSCLDSSLSLVHFLSNGVWWSLGFIVWPPSLELLSLPASASQTLRL